MRRLWWQNLNFRQDNPYVEQQRRPLHGLLPELRQPLGARLHLFKSRLPHPASLRSQRDAHLCPEEEKQRDDEHDGACQGLAVQQVSQKSSVTISDPSMWKSSREPAFYRMDL